MPDRPRPRPSEDSPLDESPTTAMPQQGASEKAEVGSEDAQTAGEPTVGPSNAQRTLGDFRMLRRLGAGGMAEVWLAEQTSLKRHVALKLLRRDLTKDETYIKRFETEAKAAAGLNHPNLVQVYTVGEHDGQHFIAQEYVQGQTLSTLLKRKGPLAAPLALHIMRQVANALIGAAEHNIVHRDIKPENIMLTRKGEVKVADFGLAQIAQGEELNLTQEGVTMGTPLYMSPEQVKGKKLDFRSDIYSFGVTCYHMLTGRPPFHGETAVAVAVQHLQDEPEPIAEIRSDLPPALCAIVDRMMAKDPDDRYQDAKSILTDVRKLLKALKESGTAGDVSLAELAPSASSGAAGERASTRTIVLRVLLLVVVAGASAGVGWWRRTPDLLQTETPPRSGVDQKQSARDQYTHALLSGGSEDAWLAVRDYWKEPDDRLWTVRATEQLVLSYLKQPERTEDARIEIERLRAYDSIDIRYELKGKLADAALTAYTGDVSRARSKLSASRNQFEDELTGSWRRLYQELDQQLAASSRVPPAVDSPRPETPAEGDARPDTRDPPADRDATENG